MTEDRIDAIRDRSLDDNDGKLSAQADRRWLLGYLDRMSDPCPPHDFQHGWTKDTDADGVLFCSMCGDIRPLAVPSIEAPATEAIPAKRGRKK